MARERVAKVRERAMYSSWFAPAVGAGVGALIARAFQSRAEYGREFRGAHGRPGFRSEVFPTRPYEEGTLPAEVGETPGVELRDQEGSRFQEMKERAGSRLEEMKDRASSRVEELKGRAGEVKERVGAEAAELKERMSEQVHSFRERLPDRERIRASTHEDAGVWALGAAALGFLFGFALPVTQKERQLLEPARRKARELGAQAKEMAVQKGSQALDQASERLGSVQQGEEHQGQHPQQQGEGAATPPALH